MSEMNKTPALTTSRLVLRPVRDGDAEARFAIGNTPEIQRMFGMSQSEMEPITHETAQRWVDHLKAHRFGWVIEIDGQLSGQIRLHTHIPEDRRAMLAVALLRPEKLGRGYGQEAVKAVMAFAFETLNLHRLGLRVFAFNTRAIASYAKSGFIEEGRERQTAYIDGVWHDDVIMGCLSHEFKALQAESDPG